MENEYLIINKSFEQFIQNQSVSENIKVIEEKRSQNVKNIVNFLIALIVMAFFLIAINSGLIAIIIAFLVFIIGLGICLDSYSKYNVFYKEKFIYAIFSFFAENISYQPNSYISENEFKKSEIFLSSFNRYNGDDYVKAKIGLTEIHFSELHVKDVSGSGKNRREYAVFDGLFFIADFNKDFKYATFVFPDFAEKFFGKFGQMLQSANIARSKLIKMDNVEFEKEFVVYSDDEIEARYILTPLLMERILVLKKIFRKIYFSFIGSKMYIAIPVFGSLFEAPVFQRIDSETHLKKNFEFIKALLGIVDVMNLNVRIWTKK